MKRKWKLLSLLLCVAVMLLPGCVKKENLRSDKPNSEKVEGIPILAWHNVVSEEQKNTNKYYINDNYTISSKQLEEELKFLSDNGYHTWSLDQLNDWYNGTLAYDDHAIVLTFDDGWLSQARVVCDLLKKYNFVGSTFVLTCNVSEAFEEVDETYYQHVSPEDMVDQSVMKYYSHTNDMHRNDDYKDCARILAWSKEKIKEDLLKSQSFVSLDYFAYPFGVDSDNGYLALEELGTKLAFKFNVRRYAMQSDYRYALPRFGIYPDTTLEEFQSIVNRTYVDGE